MSQFEYLKDVATLKLAPEKCIGCSLCVTVCPHAVLKMHENLVTIAELDHCMECGACVGNCPTGALSVKAGVGCASAIIHSWLTGEEPSCDCESGGSCG